MAYTYNTLSNVTVGSVLTASDYNEAVENSNNFRVPPLVRLRKTANQNVSGLTILSWDVQDHDTDDMWASGTTITAQTAGVYAWSAYFRVTAATAPSAAYANGPNAARNSIPLSTDMRVTFSGLWVAAANDTANVAFEPTGGATMVIDGTTTPAFFTAVWLGQVS
jgi:hypothetical protein